MQFPFLLPATVISAIAFSLLSSAGVAAQSKAACDYGSFLGSAANGFNGGQKTTNSFAWNHASGFMQVGYPQSTGNPIAIFPGMRVPRHATAETPYFQLFNETTEAGPFVITMVDPDAPYPSNPSQSQIRHFLGSNFRIGSNGFDLISSTAPITPYLQPSPPSDSPPHRYFFLLFKQPAGFENQKVVTSDTPRNKFNVTEFAKETGLGQPIAGTVMLVGPGN